MISRSRFVLIVAILSALVIINVAADGVRADAPAKTAASITLTHQSPTSVMSQLGLASRSTPNGEKMVPVWFRSVEAAGTDTAAQRGLLPDGIDFLSAYEPDKALIAYGSSEGIAELRRLIALLDFPPQVVTIEVEYFKLKDGAIHHIPAQVEPGDKMSGLIVASAGTDPEAVASVKKTLREESIGLGNSFTIKTRNNEPALINVGVYTSKEEAARTMSVLPRVNGDGSITLFFYWDRGARTSGNEPHPSAASTTNRRISDGGTLFLHVQDADTSDANQELEIALTARIAK